MYFKAFTISADVPKIFMQQFWYTIKKVQDTNSYEFLLANKKCIVNAKVFRTILDIGPIAKGVDFMDVPDDDTALTFVINLGYKGPLNRHTNMFVDHMHQLWRTLEDFAYQIDHEKEKRLRHDGIVSRLKFVRIGEDYQKYGLPIPDVMLTNETIDVSEESEPTPEPTKIKTSSKRRVKKKVTLSADDNIIFDDPDAALELAKSISQTKAEEVEAARKVHATHARIVTKSVPESTKKKSSGINYKRVVIQDTSSTPKSKPATSKSNLKGLNEGTSSKLGIPNESIVISATSSEGTGAKPGVPVVYWIS
ncbi:hypothetical protein Tco_1372309 [Tanacetum coccineum]